MKMDLILTQITRGLERWFHYLAIVSALTLPDICAAMEAEDGWSTKARYMAWWDAWMKAKYPYMTSEDAYGLRGGVVHQGKLTKPKAHLTFDRIAFTVLPAMRPSHNNISINSGGSNESVLQLDAGVFCHDVMNSVREWYAVKKDDPNVQAHLPLLLSFRPDGIAPHFVGKPVIA
jgi:hypothetical protein